jgi:hypothetical protein
LEREAQAQLRAYQSSFDDRLKALEWPRSISPALFEWLCLESPAVEEQDETKSTSVAASFQKRLTSLQQGTATNY